METNNNWGMLGHEWAVDLLQGHLARNQPRHAYLITGPKGIGRRTLALRMAQGLNCPQPIEHGTPCRECHTCNRIERMQHPDLAIVQAEEPGGTLKIDQVRELQRGLSLSPYEAKYRVALLLHFEQANPSAANALLKTLEEPPDQVILMVTAQDVESLLPTIVSRCELIRLRPLPLQVVSEGLQNQWDISPDKAKLLAHISSGRPGYALHLHQTPEVMEQRQRWLDDHQRLLSAGRVERFHYAENLSEDRTSLQEVLQTWLLLWRDVMLRAGGAVTPLTNPDYENEVNQLASSLNYSQAKEMISNLERAQSCLNRYTNARLTLEVLMLNLPRLP